MRIETRQQIVDEARSWLGTRFVHQGRVKGVGCDCAAMAFRIAQMIGMEARDIKGYGRIPRPGALQLCVSSQMAEVPIDQIKPGDVLLMRFKTEPQHLAIVTDKGIIHSYSRIAKNGKECGAVVEHRLNSVWRSRICAAYRFPGIV